MLIFSLYLLKGYNKTRETYKFMNNTYVVNLKEKTVTYLGSLQFSEGQIYVSFLYVSYVSNRRAMKHTHDLELS